MVFNYKRYELGMSLMLLTFSVLQCYTIHRRGHRTLTVHGIITMLQYRIWGNALSVRLRGIASYRVTWSQGTRVPCTLQGILYLYKALPTSGMTYSLGVLHRGCVLYHCAIVLPAYQPLGCKGMRGMYVVVHSNMYLTCDV